MVKRYSIILKSQLGPKAGTLEVRRSGAILQGILELLGHKTLLTGNAPDGGNAFEFKGEMWTPLGRLECRLSGTIGERGISGILNINGKAYEFFSKD